MNSKGRKALRSRTCMLYQISLLPGIYHFYSQTPVFKGKERDYAGEARDVVMTLLNSKIFFFVVMGICVVIGLLFMYNRKKAIPELEIEPVKEDIWFTTRDDNNRVGIVISLNLRNKSTRGIYIKDCKLSGYSAREYPNEIYLEDTEGERKLEFPEHRHVYKGQDFYLGPYTSETVWFYYESRVVTMKNLLESPFTLKDSEKRRKSLRVNIPRHADQIAMYQKMASMF